MSEAFLIFSENRSFFSEILVSSPVASDTLHEQSSQVAGGERTFRIHREAKCTQNKIKHVVLDEYTAYTRVTTTADSYNVIQPQG